MILKLLDRDREEALRITTRALLFPDGIKRSIPCWRVVWRWYDYLLAYDFCPEENVILRDVLSHAQNKNQAIGEALGQVVQTYVEFIENSGGDVTDDDLEKVIARRVAIIRAKGIIDQG